VIVAAAVSYQFRVFVGRRHSEAIQKAIIALEGSGPITTEMQGFVTDKGVYLSRRDARYYAVKWKQIPDDPDKRGMPLTSEELW
jgi:hypothetical protein